MSIPTVSLRSLRPSVSPSLRLGVLFLRSRQTTPIALALTGVAVVAGLTLDASSNHDLIRLLRMVVPLAAAVVIGVATGSPFGEAERTASHPLPPIRLGHLLLLAAAAAILLTLANLVPDGGGLRIILRNTAGFGGLGLLGARFFGAGTSWIPPLAYAGAVFADFLVKPDRDASWRWPLQPTSDSTATAIAVTLLIAGVTAIALQGSRDATGEAV
jgi:hypothetical protein